MTACLIPDAAVTTWRDLAALLTDQTTPCQADPEPWFAHDPSTRAVAGRACQSCPSRVFAACGTYAQAAREPWGVWAGVDRGLRTSKKRAAA